MTKAVAKSSFSVRKDNNKESSFTCGAEYDCVKRSNGDYTIKDNEGSALNLDEENTLAEFHINEE